MIRSENRYPLFRIMLPHSSSMILMLMTRKGRRKPSPPPKPLITGVMPIALRSLSTLAAIKFRLTLFLQPNHGFGESFNGSGHGRPHDFLSDAFSEPARK